MENTKLKETIRENSIPKLLEYFQEFEQGQKPLGEKVETKFRAAFHKDIAGLVSHIALKGIEWANDNTSAKQVKQELDKIINRFGPKLFCLAQNRVDKWQKSLNQKGKYDAASRVPNTALKAVGKVMESDLGATINFVSENKQINTAKNQKTLAA